MFFLLTLCWHMVFVCVLDAEEDRKNQLRATLETNTAHLTLAAAQFLVSVPRSRVPRAKTTVDQLFVRRHAQLHVAHPDTMLHVAMLLLRLCDVPHAFGHSRFQGLKLRTTTGHCATKWMMRTSMCFEPGRPVEKPWNIQ